MKEFVLSNGASGAPKIDYQNALNEEQLPVVLGGDGPCLVLAGAGSGKTRTITYRVAYLLEMGIRADEILLLTFTNKAAKEMMSRVEELMEGYPTGLWGGTFHSIANRILRQYANVIGYSPNFTIMDQDDAQDLVKYCLKDLKIDTKARRFPSPAVLHSMISYSRNASLSLADVIDRKYSNFFDLVPTIERIAEVYRERKKAANTMDFDDLLLLLSELLQTNEAVRQQLAGRFRYVLVDEYQDTNVIQAGIVRNLSSVYGNVLVVGDDAQSIYSFRAAEIQNILKFPDVYGNAKVFRLETNYRSTPEILGLANAVIQQNVDQFQKELKAVRPGLEKPSLVPAGDNRQEAQYIAEQVLQLRDEGLALKEIAVLFRAAHHSQALEMELARRDIPYEYRGGMKFFERAHIKDVVAYLRLVANPKDSMAWIRVLSHQIGIGAVTAGKIADVAQGYDSLDQLLESAPGEVGARAETGWRALANNLARMLRTDRLPSSLIRAVAGSSYQDYLEAEYPNYADRLEDIEQFAIFAEQYTDLTTFLEEVTLKDDYGAVREEGIVEEEKMVLSTIHQAKGLEWDAVFVINLTDGAFPHPRALSEEGGIEEERRLFYVASTRARKQLFLTYPIMSGYETMEIRQPSMFLDEIPKNLLEEVRLKRSHTPSFFGGSHSAASSARSWTQTEQEFDDGPVIVLDPFGERPKKSPGSGFLSSVDDL
ncbi:MAG: UvrD-helicase domain-containing protein [Patescibacteria group bacterium]